MLLDQLIHDFNISASTETWLSNYYDITHFAGYECSSISPGNMKGRGVALYVKQYLDVHVVSEFPIINPHCESLMVKWAGTILVIVYTPPSGRVATFLEFLENTLKWCAQIGKRVIKCGDFNTDVLKSIRSSQKNTS